METLIDTADTDAAMVLPDVARFRFRLEAIDPVRLPPFPGSALRGMLGYGLRRTACLTRQPVCDGCLLRATCVYSTLFESPAVGGGEGGRYAQLPHPFVLDLAETVGEGVAPGETFAFGINLIGPAQTQAPYLIHALQLAGQRGLGKGGGRFRVALLDRERTLGLGDWLPVYTPESGEYLAGRAVSQPQPDAAPSAVRLRFVTPLRIKRRGYLVGAAEFEPATLLRALCERIALLAGHYGGHRAELQWGQIKAQAEGVRMEHQDLYWQDWTRYSSRQDTLMEMGGLLGELRLAGPGLAAFWPALGYGQWVHVGKGTSFGLGAYTRSPVMLAVITEQAGHRDRRALGPQARCMWERRPRRDGILCHSKP